MGQALIEKRTKRDIKDKIKTLLENNKATLGVSSVTITGDTNRQPAYPAIVLDFDNSKDTEGRLGPKRLWKMNLGLVCFLRSNEYEKGKKDTEEITGTAADLIIDNLPTTATAVSEVRISESSEDCLIDIDNKTVIGNAIILEIYYFI